MKSRNLILAAAAATVISGASIAGASTVSAQSDQGDSLIDRVSNTFNLDRSEVQSVFDTAKEDRMAEREAAREAFLLSKVDEGVITTEQKTLLEDKFAEIKEAKSALKDSDLTKEEMKEQFASTKEDLQAWADENGIDLEAVRPDKDDRGHRGR